MERHKTTQAKVYIQKEGYDYYETFSSVVKLPTIRFRLAIAAIEGWSLSRPDVNNVFYVEN